MRIDGHAHACGSCLTEDDIKKYLRVHKLDKVLLCGGEPGSKRDYNYPMVSNWFHGEGVAYFFNKIISRMIKKRHLSEYLDKQNKAVYRIKKKMPEAVLNAYWINPLEYDCLEKMQEFYVNYGFSIIKLHQCWTPFEIDSQMCHTIFAWAAKQDCPVFVHLSSKKQVVKFAKMANRHPDTTFIVAHMIGSEYLTEELKHRNVYFDLSAPQFYSNKMLSSAVENYGSRRLILGSDTPYGIENIHKICSRMEQLSLSKQDKENIYGANLERLLEKQ